MKVLEIIFGPFRYRRAPAAQIDGGMGEYTFEQFQPLPAQDVINGRGYHVMRQLNVTSPGMVVLHPAGMPFDVDKVQMGEIDLFAAGGVDSLESGDVS